MHLVSIIIPAYNAGEFISKTLDSILNQTWTNWEAIVVNDGSIDNTEAIVKQYAESDNRIILVSQSNRGCSPAKNIGLGFAKGDFVQYLDADDILGKDKIKLQVEALLTSGGSAVAVWF